MIMIIIMISFFGGFDIDITFLNFERHLILDLELLSFATTDLNSEVAWEYGTYVFNFFCYLIKFLILLTCIYLYIYIYHYIFSFT